jgi:tRNA(Ile)-lysidine synthase
MVYFATVNIKRSILPSGRIGIAVSGGADSVALAFLLTKGGTKKNASKRFVILHVDHGLRQESAEEYRFVKSLAKRLGLPFRGTHAKVERRKGESLEMAARRVRLAFFAKCVKSLKLDAVATGHHMDDVAETFLMKLKRMSLSGIRETSEVNGIKFVRPLLGCRDSELKDYLRKYNEQWREDASNADVSIERNKVRHEVIPFLERTLDRNLVRHLATISERLGAGK